jgi:hypothetical protein
MSRRVKLTSDLLVRKGQASPTGGFAHAGIDLSQPLPAPTTLDLLPRIGTALGNGRPAVALRRARARTEDRVALTLRLDRDRHRRLKVFCARGQQTTQEVLIKALDAYLEAGGADCACLRGDPEECGRS